MTRARNNPAAKRRKKKVLKRSKGFRGARNNHIRLAQEATDKAMAYAYRGRKERKRDMKSLWIVRISAAAKANGISYSRLIAALKEQNIGLNRKILADIAVRDENVFSQIADLAKK